MYAEEAPCVKRDTLALQHTLHRLKDGNNSISSRHVRFVSSVVTSSRSANGFPCCAATAPSTLALVTQTKPRKRNSLLIARAKEFLDTTAHFDWRPRAQSQVVHSLSTETASRDTYELRNRPFRESPWSVELKQDATWHDKVQNYQSHFLPLLEYEQESSEAVVRERLSDWSLERLQREGYCLTNMKVQWYKTSPGNRSLGRSIASFTLDQGQLLPVGHHFQNGTQVLVSRSSPLEESAHRGSVVGTTDIQLRVAFYEAFEPHDREPWRLDVSSPAIAYQRMKDAVQCLELYPKPTQCRSLSRKRSNHPHESFLQGTSLNDLLLRGFGPKNQHVAAGENFFAPNAFLSSWARRYAEPNPLVIPGDPDLHSRGLNKTQIRAVAIMLGGMAGPSLSPSLTNSTVHNGPSSTGASHQSPRGRVGESRMSLIHGPPGTGKTKTVIEAIRILKQHFSIPNPVLLCTYTNVAVDHLVEGLVQQTPPSSLGRNVPRPLKPLRVGPLRRVGSIVEPYTLEFQITTHPHGKELEYTCRLRDDVAQQQEKLQKRIVKARQEIAEQAHDHGREANVGASPRELKAMVTKMLALRERKDALSTKASSMRHQIRRDLVRGADVICTTSITSASQMLEAVDLPIVFIDEASMSTEPASLIPLMKGSQHVALIGDSKQLPPIITSSKAQKQGLGISLFERLSDEAFLPTIMLDTQYRMHPEISRFPVHEFYGGALFDGTTDGEGNIIPSLAPPESIVHLELRSSLSTLPLRTTGEDLESTVDRDRDHVGQRRPAVVFLDHAGKESHKNRSCVNESEAKIVLSLIEDLLLRNPTLTGSQIGVIAPYAAQITLLNWLLTLDAKSKERFTNVLGPQRADEILNVEVKTVDGFEGREKDVIIFSTVRNNAKGFIGFLADPRRLNVGLTRAKRGLFVVGNLNTLKIGKWRGRYHGVDELQAMEDLRLAEEWDMALGTIHGSARALSVKKKGQSNPARGAEAWRRYATFLTEQQLVLRLKEDRLYRLLQGHQIVFDDMSAP